jgi:hypothetical protein
MQLAALARDGGRALAVDSLVSVTVAPGTT